MLKSRVHHVYDQRCRKLLLLLGGAFTVCLAVFIHVCLQHEQRGSSRSSSDWLAQGTATLLQLLLLLAPPQQMDAASYPRPLTRLLPSLPLPVRLLARAPVSLNSDCIQRLRRHEGGVLRCRSDSTAKAEEEEKVDGDRGAAGSKKSTSPEPAVSLGLELPQRAPQKSAEIQAEASAKGK